MKNNATDRLSQVSESMIRSVFLELKANGYSDGQIVALSEGLAIMARYAKPAGFDSGSLMRVVPQPGGHPEAGEYGQGLFLIGCPEGFENLCH